MLTKSASTVDATKTALAEIAGLTTRPFTEEELARAKDNILNSFLFRYDTREKVLAERVRLEFYGYPADYLETYKAGARKSDVGRCDRGGKKVHSSRKSWPFWWWATGRRSSRALDELKLGPAQPIDITIPMPKPPAENK